LKAGDRILSLGGHKLDFIGDRNKMLEIAEGPYPGFDKANVFFDSKDGGKRNARPIAMDDLSDEALQAEDRFMSAVVVVILAYSALIAASVYIFGYPAVIAGFVFIFVLMSDTGFSEELRYAPAAAIISFIDRSRAVKKNRNGRAPDPSTVAGEDLESARNKKDGGSFYDPADFRVTPYEGYFRLESRRGGYTFGEAILDWWNRDVTISYFWVYPIRHGLGTIFYRMLERDMRQEGYFTRVIVEPRRSEETLDIRQEVVMFWQSLGFAGNSVLVKQLQDGGKKAAADFMNEHGYAYNFWEIARIGGRISDGAILIHVDSHDDLRVPETMFSRPQTIADTLSVHYGIEEFIAPAVSLGLVSEIWMVMPGFTKVSDSLRETVFNGVQVRHVYPDELPDFSSETRDIILDIDEDYFFLNQRETADWPSSALMMFDGLPRRISFGGAGMHVAKELLQEELQNTIDVFVLTLKEKNIVPAVVTIAASAGDYTPAAYAPFITAGLKTSLTAQGIIEAVAPYDKAVPLAQFESALISAWDDRYSDGKAFNYAVGDSLSREEGPYTVTWNPGRARYNANVRKEKGAAYGDHRTVYQPFDGSKFNFNTVLERTPFQCLFTTLLPDGPAYILANRNPVKRYSFLLVPDPKKQYPQFLNIESMRMALAVAAASEGNIYLGFNSRGAWASVDHLHFHGWYRARGDERFLLERQATYVVAINDNVAVLRPLAYPAGVVVFESEHSASLARASMGFIETLQRREIPHNIIMVRNRVYVFPKSNASRTPTEDVFGFYELAGEMTGAQTEERYERITKQEISVRLSEVTISGEELSSLLELYARRRTCPLDGGEVEKHALAGGAVKTASLLSREQKEELLGILGYWATPPSTPMEYSGIAWSLRVRMTKDQARDCFNNETEFHEFKKFVHKRELIRKVKNVLEIAGFISGAIAGYNLLGSNPWLGLA
ncbi:MAG: UPF0489 family protein, partial [Candidatus Omnitrophota bacterium]